jgi:hypothetical protein
MTRLLKRGSNEQLDTMGFKAALGHSFDIHELAHGVMASMMAANPDARPANILEHMRATNKGIADRQADERQSATA